MLFSFYKYHTSKKMKFSIIIPVYNKADTICEALDSILSQTFSDYEIVVVDDGSTDNIKKTIMEYSELKVIHQKNSGVSMARNIGIQNASGEYICFLDADDIWFPNHLETLNNLINKYPLIGFYLTSHITRYPDGHEIGSSIFLEHCNGYDVQINDLICFLNDYSDAVIHTNSVCIDKKIIVEKNLWFEPYEKIGEDTDLWLRIALFYSVAISKEETTLYRKEYSTATSHTSNSFTWVFAQRECAIMESTMVPLEKKESVKIFLDRYRMNCSRNMSLEGKRKDAQLYLRKIYKKHGKTYWATYIFSKLPQVICQVVNQALYK